MTNIRSAWAALRHRLFILKNSLAQKRCNLCGTPVEAGTVFQTGCASDDALALWPATLDCHTLGICKNCLSGIQLIIRHGNICRRCGEPFPAPHPGQELCGHCLQMPPPWEHCYFLSLYRKKPLSERRTDSPSIVSVLLGVKFHAAVHQAKALGLLFSRHQGLTRRAGDYDAVVPVPLFGRRFAERGYNQAFELFGPMARKLRIPMRPGLLRRVRHTPHQMGKSRLERRHNVKAAFDATPGVRGMRLLLVDDVMTTGATLAEAAQALLQAGAVAVDIAAVARAPGRNMLELSREHC